MTTPWAHRNKEFCVTCDFVDDMLFTSTKLTPQHLDEMMSYAASLGATRFEWVTASLWTLYDAINPLGYNVMEAACDAAHRHGMRFDAVYKPLESGLSGPKMTLPPTFPLEPGDRAIATEAGILHTVRRYSAEHPEYRIARRKGEGDDPGGRLAEVRLVTFEKDHALQPEDVSFWYSDINGRFRPYEGKLEVSTCQAWSLYEPYQGYQAYSDAPSTYLCFKGFDLPAEMRFIEVRCERTEGDGTFRNHIERLVELVNDRGEPIPCTPSTIPAEPLAACRRAKDLMALGLSAYLLKPEVQALLADETTFMAHVEENCSGMYQFVPQYEVFSLDAAAAGRIAVHRGKPRCHPSVQHPIYPEVRRNWLEAVQHCIDCGVDGVNIRISRHGGMNEPWAYGLNDPVIDQLKNPDDRYELSLVNGRAFDIFMREAAVLVHDHGKEFGVHLCGLILGAPDKLFVPPKPVNFVWNWEMWVRELADYAEFHKTNFFNFRHAREIIDHFGYVVRDAGKPFIYQSGQAGGVSHFDGPHPFLAYEMAWARRHPHITCYNLYETASYFRMTDDGRYEGSPDIRALVQQHWTAPHLG
jgi:hypothetical protein